MKRTLGLTIIVGPNDAKDMDRLLSSFDCKKAFNETVIVATTQDSEVFELGKKYGEVSYFPWTSERYPYGNFAGARNAAVERSTTDYWMWLDADDLLSSEADSAFQRIRGLLDEYDFDVFVAPYILSLDKKGKPEHSLLRERIFRRESGIHWKYPVHEQLTIDKGHHKIADLVKGFQVLHQPTKAYSASLARNLQILEHEYFRSPDFHTRYYYARDLWASGKKLASIPIMVDFIANAQGNEPNLYDAAAMLADYYLYREGKGDLAEIRHDTLYVAEKYAHLAAIAGDGYAEPLVYLGDFYNMINRIDLAERCFKKAMSKKMGNGGVQHSAYYEEIPANRLMLLNYNKKELEQALWYTKIALEHSNDNPVAIDIRKKVISELKAA